MKAHFKLLLDQVIKSSLIIVICITASILPSSSLYADSRKDFLSKDEREWLAKNQSQITRAVETGYAPFVFIDSKDRPAGLAHDYMLLLESKLGVHFKEKRFSTLNEIFDRLKSGEIHIVNAVTNTPARSKFITFTDPFISVPNVIIVQKNRIGPLKEETLKGLKVSLVKGYAVTEHFTSKGLNFTPDLTPDDITALYNVSSGHTDAAIIDLATASFLISTKGITNLRIAGETTFAIRLAMGTAIAEPMLNSIIQKGIAQITEAERKEITSRWINVSSGNIFADWRFWAVVIGALFALCTAIFGNILWNRTLRRQVALRTDELTRKAEALQELKEELQTQNEELSVIEEELRDQNDHLMDTEEILRIKLREHEASLKLLHDSEERYRLIMESVAVIPWAFSIPENCWTYVGPQVTELLGYAPEEWTTLEWWLGIIHPEDQTWVPAYCADLVSRGEGHSMEYRLMAKDGSVVWVNDLVTIEMLDGKPHIMRGVIVNITDRKQALEEKRLFEQQLQHTQKLESLGVLSGGIAHDFNNILAIIKGNCSLATMDAENAENYINEIDKASDRAAALCRQMLAYAGKAQLSMDQVNMCMLVDEMISMLKATMPQNAVIIADIQTDIPFITADASQIRQIVMNLIINAAEAIGKEQGEVRVSLTATTVIAGRSDYDYHGKVIPPGHYICLEVTDTGCGMDEETKWRIFEPFYTTKFTGRGLGMSAVLGIINSHNGALQLFSKPGQGTTFKVYLSVRTSKSAGEDDQHQSATAVPWQGSGTILLVEDKDQVRNITNKMLTMFGFTVLEAVNGREALELYQNNTAKITLVLTDMGMPVMDGYELFLELKKLAPELPIIVSSGFGDADVTSRMGHDNIAGILSKPYSPSQLREILKKVLADEVTAIL